VTGMNIMTEIYTFSYLYPFSVNAGIFHQNGNKFG